MRGFELRDEGCFTDAGMYLEVCHEGGEVLILLLEQSDNLAVLR